MKIFKIAVLIAITMLAVNANAQIKISTSGNVGIGGVTTPEEVLELNGYIRGNSAYGGALRINTASNGYVVIGPENNTACHMMTDRLYFYFGQSVVSYNYFGSYNTNNLNFATGICWGNSGNVRMTILNSNGFVGIGTTTPVYMLDVNGDINTSSCVRVAGVIKLSSDERLKNNIKNLSDSLGLLTNLRGVSYKFNAPTPPASLQPLSISQSDTSKKINPPVQNVIDTTFYNRTHIGFLAQEIQKVFPQLVYADKNGMLSVDYISLIPVLVESIKELNGNHVSDSLNFKTQLSLLKNKITSDSIYFENKLNGLESSLNQCCGKSKLKSAQVDNTPNESLNPTDVPSLYQNAPNPFNQMTTIGYYLPLTVGKSIIYIYNMQGIQIKSISLSDRGNSKVIVNGSELTPGIYLYALIVDGKEIDTKRMILTN